MADLLLTPTGDLDLTTNDLRLVTGSNEIAQHLRIRLKFFLGEWFLDTRIGVPYIQQVLRKRPQLAIVQDIIRRTVLSTPGVVGLLSLSFDLDSTTRRFTVELRAEITGDEVLDFSEELIL